MRQDVESMSWLLLITFERDKFKKELVSLQAEFQGTVESPEITRLESEVVSQQIKGVPVTTQPWGEDKI